MHIPRPAPADYDPAFRDEIALVPDAPDFALLLQLQSAETHALVASFGERGASTRHRPGAWTVREVIGHLADVERVLAYRALAMARGATTPLPPFDERRWVARSDVESRPLDDVLAEQLAVRGATVALVRGLPPGSAARSGIVGTARTTVAAMLYLIAGHERHHQAVLRERYIR